MDSDKAGLRWTRQPLVDMGVAAITVFSERETPGEVTFEDLEKFASYAERAYFTEALKGYITVLFTSNFINPSFSAEKKRKYVADILRSYKASTMPDGISCAFCGRPSIQQANQAFLAYRDLLPMLTGRGVINFFPQGRSGLSLCGLCTLSVQAISLGAPMCSGRALIVASDEPSLVIDLVRQWLPAIRKNIQLSEATGEKPAKMGRPKTRVIDALVNIDIERRSATENVGITVFHLTNSGQGPYIDIFDLPSITVRFIMIARTQKYRESWNAIVQRSWDDKDLKEEQGNGKKKGKKKAKEVNPFERRNRFYEDLFTLPDNGASFIRKYFLYSPSVLQKSNDKADMPYEWEKTHFMRWNITELFLKEVVGMQKKRIEAIKALGDRIADEIVLQNDKKLWRDVYSATKFFQLRNVLIRHSQRCIRQGRAPLITFEPFLEIFEEGEELTRADWNLAWDLVLIRLIEKLYDRKWFDSNKDVLEIEEEQIKEREEK